MWLCVAPFNLVKGAATAVITALVYKRISVVIHMAEPEAIGRRTARM